MNVYRLCKDKYKHDISGFGAEKYGGRWNNKGTRLLYTSQSRALAKLEVAVHVNLNRIPKNYYMVTIEVPDEIILQFDKKKLKDKNWKSNPPIEFTQTEGDKFVIDKAGLVIKVPSAIVQGDYNFLINPLHPDFNKVKVIDIVPFRFDERLFL